MSLLRVYCPVMLRELRDSQQHATMSSLKAAHTAHRVANEIFSKPTAELSAITERKQRLTAAPIEFTRVTVRWLVQPFFRWPTWKEMLLILFLWIAAGAVLYHAIMRRSN